MKSAEVIQKSKNDLNNINDINETFKFVESFVNKTYLNNLSQCKVVEMPQHINDAKIRDNIRLFKISKIIYDKNEDSLNKLINISDIGILLSYREGLPRNIMEFMACGRKVIATDIRGCRDLICDETIGTLVNVDDYESTAKAIEKYYILNDKSFEVSEEIRKYDIESINSELLKIYEDVQLDINYDKGLSSYVSNRWG